MPTVCAPWPGNRNASFTTPPLAACRLRAAAASRACAASVHVIAVAPHVAPPPNAAMASLSPGFSRPRAHALVERDRDARRRRVSVAVDVHVHLRRAAGPVRSRTPSMMRMFAWCGMNRSISSGDQPRASAQRRVESSIERTANGDSFFALHADEVLVRGHGARRSRDSARCPPGTSSTSPSSPSECMSTACRPTPASQACSTTAPRARRRTARRCCGRCSRRCATASRRRPRAWCRRCPRRPGRARARGRTRTRCTRRTCRKPRRSWRPVSAAPCTRTTAGCGPASWWRARSGRRRSRPRPPSRARAGTRSAPGRSRPARATRCGARGCRCARRSTRRTCPRAARDRGS